MLIHPQLYKFFMGFADQPIFFCVFSLMYLSTLMLFVSFFLNDE